MKKLCPIILTLIISLFAFKVFAATLTLDKIGALDTGGAVYSEWWYTGTNPTLYGTADDGATVAIKIGDTEGSTAADGSGSWAFYSEELDSGDHAVVITSEGESLSFTLHVGQSMPADIDSQTTESTVTVPETGYRQLVFGAVAGSLFLLAWYFWDRKRSLQQFEAQF